MALEWVLLGYAAAAEAVMLLLLTLPGLGGLRRGLVAVTRSILKPLLVVVPLSLFLLADIYWKYEASPHCSSDGCTVSDLLHHSKSMIKVQRNAILVAAVLLFYWLLLSITSLLLRIHQLSQRVENFKSRD